MDEFIVIPTHQIDKLIPLAMVKKNRKYRGHLQCRKREASLKDRFYRLPRAGTEHISARSCRFESTTTETRLGVVSLTSDFQSFADALSGHASLIPPLFLGLDRDDNPQNSHPKSSVHLALNDYISVIELSPEKNFVI